jgi:hypothetical protein
MFARAAVFGALILAMIFASVLSYECRFITPTA